MSEEIVSQDTGKNVDNLDAGWEEDKQTEQPKAKSNVAKLLAERNELRKKAQELESKLSNSDFDEDKVQAMIEQAQLKAREEAYLEADKSKFIETYGEDNIGDIETLIESKNGAINYSEAATLLGISNEEATKPNPNRLSFAWNTPASLKQQKTTAQLNDDDLKARANEELKSMLGIG